MKKKPTLYIAFSAVVIVAIGLGYFLMQKKTEQVSLPAPAVTPPPPQVTQAPPPVAGPVVESQEEFIEPEEKEPPLIEPPSSLNNSEQTVMALVDDLSPELVQWVVPDEQIRKAVLSIDLMAEGKVPSKYLPVDYTMPDYQVTKLDGKTLPDTSNYERATALVDAITAIPPDTMAKYLNHWQPLTNSAYGELGKPGNFKQRVQMALDQIINAKPLPANATLIRPSVFYKYEDKQLEQSSDVQKLLWRMGPDNMAKVQAYAKQLKDTL